MTDIQKQVQSVIDDLVTSGAERGLQVTAYVHGELIVDAVAGVADPTSGRPVTADTLFYTYSAGKAMTAAAAHVLVERGLITYDTPIAELWPEFAAHGKQGATVEHALTHTVGVPSLPSDVTPEEVCDWDTICARIAALPPQWEPGTRTGYHAYTFGYLVGEIVRRAGGRHIRDVLRDDVAGPIGHPDDLFFGVPDEHLERVARLEDSPSEAQWLASLADDDPFFALAPRAVTPNAALGNRTDIIQADIPAGGKMTARAIARLYAALLGDVDGVALVSAERLRTIASVTVSGMDAMFGQPVRRGLGFDLGYFAEGTDEVPTTFGWGGVGGSYAFGDTASGLAFGLTKNLLNSDFATTQKVAGMVREAVATN